MFFGVGIPVFSTRLWAVEYASKGGSKSARRSDSTCGESEKDALPIGRHVVGNLTIVSTSVRYFNTLVLGYYFAERGANEVGGEDPQRQVSTQQNSANPFWAELPRVPGSRHRPTIG